MTTVEIRQSFNELIRAYRASWPRTHTARVNAAHIMNAVKAHPWLMDQIPWDIFDLAARDAEVGQ